VVRPWPDRPDRRLRPWSLVIFVAFVSNVWFKHWLLTVGQWQTTSESVSVQSECVRSQTRWTLRWTDDLERELESDMGNEPMCRTTNLIGSSTPCDVTVTWFLWPPPSSLFIHMQTRKSKIKRRPITLKLSTTQVGSTVGADINVFTSSKIRPFCILHQFWHIAGRSKTVPLCQLVVSIVFMPTVKVTYLRCYIFKAR